MKVMLTLYSILLTEKCYHVSNIHIAFRTVFLDVIAHPNLQQVLPSMPAKGLALMLVTPDRPGWWLLKTGVTEPTS